jgi:hypothetical protein
MSREERYLFVRKENCPRTIGQSALDLQGPASAPAPKCHVFLSLVSKRVPQPPFLSFISAHFHQVSFNYLTFNALTPSIAFHNAFG